MANRYWVGGTDNWNATAGTKWALTSGGAGGQSVPGTSDDVFIDAYSSGNTITVSAHQTCKSLDCVNGTGGAFSGTIANSTYSIRSQGNITLSPTMTLSGAGGLQFLGSTAGTLFNTGNLTTGNYLYINMTGSGSVTIVGNFTSTSTTSSGSIGLIAGILNMGSGTFSLYQLVSGGSGVRTLNLNSSTITLTNNNALVMTNSNLTFNAGTSTIITTSLAPVLNLLGFTYYNLDIRGGTGLITLTGANTFNRLIFTPSNWKTIDLDVGVTQTVLDKCLYNGVDWMPFYVRKATTLPWNDFEVF